MLVVAACSGGADDAGRRTTTTTPAIGGTIAEPTCEAVLDDAHFSGDGSVVLSAVGGGVSGCTIDLGSTSPALAKLGLRASCPQGTSVLIAVDLDVGALRWWFDQAETLSLDDGECLGAVRQ